MARTKGSQASLTGLKVKEVALKLFARYGFAAVSMRKIASSVGVQVGTLYQYTPDKQTLLFDLMFNHMSSVLENWHLEPHGLSPVEQLDRFVRFHIRFHVNHPDAVFVSYMELRNLTVENFNKLDRQRRKYEGFLENILILGRDRGVFEIEDVRLISMAIIAMLNGILTWYKPNGRLPVKEIERIYSEMALKSVNIDQ